MTLLASVRLRLTLWNVGVLSFILLALGLTLRYSLLSSLSSDVDHELASLGSSFHETRYPLDLLRAPEIVQQKSPSFDHQGMPNDLGPVERLFPKITDSAISVHRPRFFFVEGTRGTYTSLAPSNIPDVPWDKDALRQAALGTDVYSTVRSPSGPLRVMSVPVRYRGQVQGVVQFAHPTDEIQHEVNHLTRVLLALSPFALLIASLGGAFLTDRALRPVRAVTQAAGRIQATNLSGRLAVSGGGEFAELARTFNEMLRRLEEAFARLENANSQLRRFTADASHELRTPLTIIKAHTSLALAQPHTAEEYRAALAVADRAADRTTCLVQDLLLLARSDAGQMEMPRRPVPVTEILEYAMDSARRPEGPSIRLRLPDPPPCVLGNADSLIRLFGNLIANAVRHTPKDGTITLTASEQGTEVVIEVADTGEGIAPKHLPFVRERFYRADESRACSDGGTGLGLSICQSIADAHGGRMEIQSVLAKGTTVAVTLPGAHGD